MTQGEIGELKPVARRAVANANAYPKVNAYFYPKAYANAYNYAYAWLIIQCKEAAIRVSPQTWEEIEERMFRGN